VETVFVGGGTPTLLPAADLVRVLARCARLRLADGARSPPRPTPDSVDERYLAELRAGGFTRVSLRHAVGGVVGAARAGPHAHARPAAAGGEGGVRSRFEQVSLDLIYGTPAESGRRLGARPWTSAGAQGPTHVSAYALIVEDGTRLGRQVAKGLLPRRTTTCWPTAT
jgi:oxygen-independent coproporphyrinogen-3 oxidase